MTKRDEIQPNSSGSLDSATFRRDLKNHIRKFTASLKHDFAAQIALDSRTFKLRVVRLLRLNLPPGPGRPPDETITRAAKMRAQNRPWHEIYQKCIPHFSELDDGIRQLAMIRLRASVRSRRHGGQRRKGRPDSQRQEICA